MELIGCLLIIIVLYRVNSTPEFNVAHRVLTGLKFWYPPRELEENLEKAKSQKQKRSFKGLADKMESLGLKQVIIHQGMLIGEHYWSHLDRMVAVFVVALIVGFYSVSYRVSHPGDTMIGTGLLPTLVVAATPLYGLLQLVKGRADTRDGKGALVTGALSILLSLITLLMPSTFLTFDVNKVLDDASQEFMALLDLAKISHPDLTGPLRIGLALLSALVVTGLVLPAARTSTPLFSSGWFLYGSTYLLMADLSLTLALLLSFVRPLALDILQNSTMLIPCTEQQQGGACNPRLPQSLSSFLPPTDDGWLKCQCGLVLALIVVRALLVRPGLKYYLDYQAVETLTYDLQAVKKEVGAADIRDRLNWRLRYIVEVTIEYVGPLIWLATLVLQLFTIYFVPQLMANAIDKTNPELASTIRNTGQSGVMAGLGGFDLTKALEPPHNLQKFKDLMGTFQHVVILPPLFFRHVCSYLIFWSTLAWFISYFLSATYNHARIFTSGGVKKLV